MKPFTKHKYNARPTNYDGYRYDSKLEASYAAHLSLLQKAGEVVFYLRQVPLHLAPSCKYLVDFMVFESSGNVRFIDIKGIDTPISIAKRKVAEDKYPVEIEVLKRGDF